MYSFRYLGRDHLQAWDCISLNRRGCRSDALMEVGEERFGHLGDGTRLEIEIIAMLLSSPLKVAQCFGLSIEGSSHLWRFQPSHGGLSKFAAPGPLGIICQSVLRPALLPQVADVRILAPILL